ncbi:MAG: hypothetical protein IKR49_10370 [Clostridia bacterium]|nr:hypothetical protein [Clostridia bacterium]
MLFFEPTILNTADCTARFTAKDGETVFGSCDLLLHDNVAEIISCDCKDSNPEITEGLFRAALNFAANRGCYIAVCSAEGTDDVRDLLGFLKQNGRWQNDIPTLLTGHCHKN